MKLGGAFKPIGPLEVQQALEAARARGDDETEVAIHKLHPGHLNPGHLRLTQGFRFNVVNWCWNLTN